MDPLISSYIVVVAISGVLNVLLALFAMNRRTDFAGTNAFIVIALGSAVYTFGFALELTSNTLGDIFFWIRVEYLGMPFISPASLLMVMHFVGLDKLRSWRSKAALYAIPCLTTLIVWTNDIHHWFYRSIYLRPDAPSPLADMVMGPWYVVHGSFTFGCLLASLCLMVWKWKKTMRVYLRQMVTILIGLLLPTLGSLLYLLHLTPYGMDPVPVIMSLTASLYIWAIFSRGMLTAAPIARENLFESMRDGVLVLNNLGRLIDYNHAAAAMMDGLSPASLGRPLAGLLAPAGPAAAEYVERADPLQQEERELEWTTGGMTRYYQIRSFPVRKQDGAVAGRMLILIDATERKLLEDRLRQLATTDSLTGIYNRSRFMDLSAELLYAAAAVRPVSFVLMDIDHFKNINDRFGHSTGDEALRHVVGICKRHLRPADLFGRYGGEEFVFCLPDTPPEEAARLCNRIREDIAASPLTAQGGEIRITASFGAAASNGIPGADDALETMLETLLTAADQALYASKHAGRNCVYLAGGRRLAEYTAAD